MFDRKAYEKLYREKHKERIKLIRKKSFDLNREHFYNLLKQRRVKITNLINRYKLFIGCIKCGYKKHAQALHLDHINRSKKIKHLGHLKGSSNIKKIKDEIRKCQVLCANCHSVKTYQEKDYKKLHLP